VNVHGTAALAAPPVAVFRAICDPGVLLEIIPGCEAVQQVGPAEYRGVLTLRLPGVTGSYRTDVRLVDVAAPGHAGMEGHLEGTMGTIDGRADFTLAGSGAGTVLDYRGTGVIQGPLARLDSRFAERLAETLIAQGLRALDARLAREALPAGVAGDHDPGDTRPATEGPA
jgi:carbon monoxide dehydrogenase subunit G